MANVAVQKFPCFPSAGAQHRPQRSAPTRNSINTSSLPYIEVLRGRDGRDGRDGVPGPHGPQGQRGEQGVAGPRGPQGQKGEQRVAGPPGPRNGGVVYTRWGKTSCPNVTGTELVYAGRAGGSWFAHTGGGANYLCACPMIQTTLHTNLECKGSALCMELSMKYGEEGHSKLFTATMSPVLCAMLQQGWQ